MHRKVSGFCNLLHRRKRKFLASPPRAVWLRDNSGDFEIRLCQKMFERRNGELRRAAEYDSHPPRHLPLALFPELFEFSLDEVALQHAEVLQKEDSVEVIDLVAKSSRQQVFAANFERLTLGILRFDGDKLRTHHVAAKTRNREAAFLLADLAFRVSDLRIRQHNFRFRIFPAGHI